MKQQYRVASPTPCSCRTVIYLTRYEIAQRLSSTAAVVVASISVHRYTIIPHRTPHFARYATAVVQTTRKERHNEQCTWNCYHIVEVVGGFIGWIRLPCYFLCLALCMSRSTVNGAEIPLRAYIPAVFSILREDK